MTDEELKAARAIADGATPGPWEAAEFERYAAELHVGRVMAWRIFLRGHYNPATNSRDCDWTKRDAQFIAASRTLVPALLDEVARREVCWSCPDCAFTYAAYHVLTDGSHACPVCEAERLRKDADDQTVNAYRLMKQRDEALAIMEQYRAVAVASLALRVTESTDVPGESIAEIEGNVTAAQARTGRALARWRNAVDIARAAGLLTDEELK